MVHSDVYAELIRKQQQIDADAKRITELEAERDFARRDQRASEQAATDANRENHQLTTRIEALERERSDDQARRIVAEQRVRWLEAALRDLLVGAEQQSQSHADVIGKVRAALGD